MGTPIPSAVALTSALAPEQPFLLWFDSRPRASSCGELPGGLKDALSSRSRQDAVGTAEKPIPVDQLLREVSDRQLSLLDHVEP